MLKTSVNSDSWCKEEISDYSEFQTTLPYEKGFDSKTDRLEVAELDGDQVQSFVFSRKDIISSSQKEDAIFKVQYIDAFYWDKYYERYILELECKVSK